MNRLMLLMTCLMLASCCGKHTEVKYEYEGVVITRVDKCAKTSFYYGNSQDESSGKIWAEYSGINDGFSAYLQFGPNGEVTILEGDGYFQSVNLDTSLFRLDSSFFYEGPKGLSVYYINLATKFEAENRRNKGSGVKATYKIDENEWW